MGIVKDAELRKGKAELARALVAKGVAAQPYERLDALAAKVAGASGGGSGGTPEKFAGAVLVPPLPGLSVASLVSAPPVTWNPSDKTTGAALSNNNLSASFVGAQHGVRATRGIVAGKKYFEVLLDSVSQYGTYLGVADAAFDLSNQVTDSATHALILGANRYKYPGGTQHDSAAWSALDVVGLAIDADNKTLQLYRNGVASGAALSLSHIVGELIYPVISGLDGGYTATARFAAASFTYSPPAGYSAWDS